MIKLKDILSEVMNTYQVQASMMSDRKVSITSILDQIRGLEKVTIVNNITPEDYKQKENIEFTRVKIKFVSRTDPKQDLEIMKKSMMTSDLKTTDMRIDGLKNVVFKSETDDKTIRLVESIIKTQAAEIEVFYIFEYLKMPSYKLNKCFLK